MALGINNFEHLENYFNLGTGKYNLYKSIKSKLNFRYQL